MTPPNDPDPTTTDTPRRVALALRQFRERVENPRALSLRVDQRAALEQAADRVAAQLGSDAECVLTIALAGGSGVGKSTIINALATTLIAEAAEQRPCTMQATIYHHRDVPQGGLPPDLVTQARTVIHDRPELRQKVVVDTPDLDTFATQNRAATRAMLKAAGLVLYVFTPEKYWDERAWSVIREEQRFSSCLALLNKADTVPVAALDRAAEEIRRRFAELGKPDIAVLRIAAARHVPGTDGRAAPSDTPVIDEFTTLRAYIEHELHEGDIARMRRDQRLRVVEHLESELQNAVPRDLETKLDGLASLARAQADAAAERLAPTLADAFMSLEAELRPLITLRRHQMFTGPFRIWLALGDFFGGTLPRLARRLRGLGQAEEAGESLLGFTTLEHIEQCDRAASGALRDAVFQGGLPVERWRAIAGEPHVDSIPATLQNEVRHRFEAAASHAPKRVRWVARATSAVGAAIPVLLSAYALFSIVWNMAHARPFASIDALGTVLALTFLSYVVLHSITTLALIGTQPAPIQDLGKQSIRAVLERRYGGWVSRVQSELTEDLEALRAPLATLHVLASATPRAVAYVPRAAAPKLPDPAPLPQSPSPEASQTLALPAPDDHAAEPAAPPDVADHAPEPAAPPEQTPARPSLRPAELFRQAVERHAGRSSET